MKREPIRVLSLLFDQPWAIRSQELQTILDVVQNRADTDLEAVASRVGRPLDNAEGNSVTMRGSTAILAIEGPLFRYANLFTALSGASSVEMLSQDLQAAIDSRAVRQILLNVNSPGGQVDGINELADMIRAANDTKPVIAYVDGLSASAGYWLASAASRIVVNESAFLGSIGVVAALTDNREAQQRQGVKRYEIVSSQSPRKRPDPGTEQGRAQILEQVDALAQLFIDRVASFRNVTTATVLERFGQGGVLPARAAIEAGMADALGSFEPLIADLNAVTPASAARITTSAANTHKEGIMPPNQPEPPNPAPVTTPAPAPPAAAPAPPPPAAIAAPAAPAATASERQRIAAIINSEEARGRESLARMLALETDQDVETARKILAAAPITAPAAAPNPLAAAMAQVPNPKVPPGDANSKDDVAAEAQAILRHVPQRHLLQRPS